MHGFRKSLNNMTTTCWDKSNGITKEQPNAFACGRPNATTPFVNCCWHGDICLSDNVCHYTHPQTNGSGYYISGCTDPNWRDPSCPRQCGMLNNAMENFSKLTNSQRTPGGLILSTMRELACGPAAQHMRTTPNYVNSLQTKLGKHHRP